MEHDLGQRRATDPTRPPASGDIAGGSRLCSALHGARAVLVWIEVLGMDGPPVPRWRAFARGAATFAVLAVRMRVGWPLPFETRTR